MPSARRATFADVRLAEVVQVLDALAAADVRHWVAGGWGVDALVGRQTREHRDLDLAVDLADLDICLAELTGLGYVSETDELPVRVELRSGEDGWVDVHPVSFDEAGHGVQGDPGGHHFDYPPEVFTSGALGARPVPCLSVAQQLVFHSGYPPRPHDVLDLALLEGLSDG